MKNFLLILPALGVLISLQAQLSGAYTIDSKLPTKKTNFSSLSEAAMALQFQGVEGDVTIELKDAQYYEPLVLEGVNNDFGFTVHFTAGENQVEFINDGLSLLISNSSNVTLSNMKFSATSTQISSMVQLRNASEIALRNNEFYSGDDKPEYFNIITLSNGSDNNQIVSNTFKGTGGITIERLSNQNAIIGNQFYFQGKGVEILSALNNKVEDNIFKGMNKQSSTGIVLDGYVGRTEIASNAIQYVKNGITQELIYRPSQEKLSGVIANNVVESFGDAIVLTNNVDNLKIAFNTISVKEGSVLVVRDEIKNTVGKISLLANNMINQEEVPVLDIAKQAFLLSADYNNIYNEQHGFIAKLAGQDVESIEDWKAQTNAQYSISADPDFIETGEMKYLLSEKSPCIDAGPSAFNIGVLADYDGDARGEITEIGADEFNKLALEEIINQIQLAEQK